MGMHDIVDVRGRETWCDPNLRTVPLMVQVCLQKNLAFMWWWPGQRGAKGGGRGRGTNHQDVGRGMLGRCGWRRDGRSLVWLSGAGAWRGKGRELGLPKSGGHEWSPELGVEARSSSWRQATRSWKRSSDGASLTKAAGGSAMDREEAGSSGASSSARRGYRRSKRGVGAGVARRPARLRWVRAALKTGAPWSCARLSFLAARERGGWRLDRKEFVHACKNYSGWYLRKECKQDAVNRPMHARRKRVHPLLCLPALNTELKGELHVRLD